MGAGCSVGGAGAGVGADQQEVVENFPEVRPGQEGALSYSVVLSRLPLHGACRQHERGEATYALRLWQGYISPADLYAGFKKYLKQRLTKEEVWRMVAEAREYVSRGHAVHRAW